MKLAILAIGVLLVEGALALAWLRPAALGNLGTAGRRRFAILLAQCALGVFLVAGAYVEARWKAFTGASARLEALADSPASVGGDPAADPGLLRTLAAEADVSPRPDFTSAETLRRWQAGLRRNLADEVFRIRAISEAKPVAYRLRESERVADDITRTSLLFESFDGSMIPAYLFHHDAEEAPRPGIVVVPGHVRPGASGLAQTAGLVSSLRDGAALELARAGFVTLTFELRGFGELGAPYNTEHVLVAYNAILAGRFYKAIIAEDIKRAVDLLQSLPTVDAGRIGLTGASYGGEMAVTYGALDERVKVVVFQSHGGVLGPQPGVTGTREDQPHYCHVIPGSSSYLYNEDIFYLLAPRPTLGVRGDRDPPKDPLFGDTVGRAWAALGARDSFQFVLRPGGHEPFFQVTAEFFLRHL